MDVQTADVGWVVFDATRCPSSEKEKSLRFLLGCASMGYAKSCKGVLALVENLVANQVITKPSSSLPSQTMRNVHYVQNYHLTVGNEQSSGVFAHSTPVPTISQKLVVRSKQRWTWHGSEARAKDITDRIVSMLVLDLRPVYMVECERFKDLVACLEPGYTIPSRKLITSNFRQKHQVCF